MSGYEEKGSHLHRADVGRDGSRGRRKSEPELPKTCLRALTLAGGPASAEKEGGGVGPNLQVALSRMSKTELLDTIRNGRMRGEHPTQGYSMPAWAALGDDAIDVLFDFIVSIQEGK